MIDYCLLGPVRARQGDWAADLAPQQQLLLAVLVMERGLPVQRQTLIRILWDEDARVPETPERALARAVADLRAQLRAAPGSPAQYDPVPVSGDTYRLLLAPDQADVLRFRAKADRARENDGPGRVALLHAALGEWGADVTGLFGGQPLCGLRGYWADSTRGKLREDYRDARYLCLQQDFNQYRYDRVSAECRRLATEPAALHDEKFLALWMIAAYRSGHRSDAERIYQASADSLRAELGVPPIGSITRLAEVIRTEDPRLDGPGDLVELALAQPAPPPVRREPRSAGPRSKQRRPMTTGGRNITFNNSGNARIGVQAGEVSSPVVHMGAEPDEAADSTAAEHLGDSQANGPGQGNNAPEEETA